jgi:hypothetical protein
MLSKLKKIMAETLKRNFDYILSALSWRLPDWLFYYYHSIFLKTDNPRLASRDYKTYFNKFITEADCELLEKNGYPAELVLLRLRAGDKAVILGKDDEIEHIIWGASSEKYLKLSGTTLDPGKHGLIFYGAHTKESSRLKGFFPTALTELYNSYQAEGRSRIYSIVSIMNQSSLALHKQSNFEQIGELFYFIIFGINICYHKKWPFPVSKIKLFFKKPLKDLPWV